MKQLKEKIQEVPSTLIGLAMVAGGGYLFYLCRHGKCTKEYTYMTVGLIVLGVYLIITDKPTRMAHLLKLGGLIAKFAGKYLPVVAVLLVLFAGCSPSKRVLENQRLSAEVGAELVKRGLCVNDTIFLTKITADTLIHIDSSYVVFGLSDEIDSLMGDLRVRVVRDTLYLTRRDTSRTITKVMEKKSVVRDRTKEAVLERELAEAKTRIEGMKADKWMWIVIGFAGGMLSILIGVFIFRK